MSRDRITCVLVCLTLLAGCAPKGAPQKTRPDPEGQVRRNLKELSLGDGQSAKARTILRAAALAARQTDSDREQALAWTRARREIISNVLTAEQASQWYERLDMPDYRRIAADADAMLSRIRGHAEALAAFGPRQTGQEGCDKALAYVRDALAEATGGLDVEIEEFSQQVTVALDRTRSEQLALTRTPPGADSPSRGFSHIVVAGRDGQTLRIPAYALTPNCVQPCSTHPPDRCPLKTADSPPPHCPNCEQPRRMVDLAGGSWDDFKGKDVTNAVVLLDFNSGDAWMRAASLGAYGAIFIAPQRTTVFQADAKYAAMLPLHFPRLYVQRKAGLAARRILARRGRLTVTLANRLRFVNVPALGMSLTIPGRQRDRCFVLAGHIDARSIAPDLSFGGAEVWGIAELIELTRYFAANPPACDIQILFVTGHWQGQRVMRDYVAYDDQPGKGRAFRRAREYYRLAMGVDLDPEGRSVNLISEGSWDYQSLPMYSWLGSAMFRSGGWRDEILGELGLDAEGVELFGGVRPVRSETLNGVMAPRNDRSPLVYAPRYPTAEQPWQALAVPTFAFQTSRLARLAHNTPLDRLGPVNAAAVDRRLRPQVQITLAVLEHLMAYPAEMLPKPNARRRKGKTWGGWVRLDGRVQRWDRKIGWFAEKLPEDDRQKLQTLVHAYPLSQSSRARIGPRLRNYFHWPMCPTRGQHRELQSFMFQDLLLLDRAHFQIPTAYAAHPGTQYNVLAYSLDEAGRIRYATDFGVHGDGNKSFQCTDLGLDTWSLHVPVSMFECGTLELFDLVDPQRYNPSDHVRGTWFQTYGIQEHEADPGVAPHLRITGIKDVESHTDVARWGFSQYGPTAMVFLPADYHAGIEVLLGEWRTNRAILNNPDPDGAAQGYRLESGQTIRLASSEQPTALACIRQLTTMNQQRLKEFARHDVASPLAKDYHAQSVQATLAADTARAAGDWDKAQAQYSRAWIFESLAYRHTLALLTDVVSTTVLYFVLLIPFSFLLERLVFPQRTVLRTAAVAVTIFAVFAAVLYLFHPGFKLANNVIVTITAFVIVVMTIPALILLLVRGVAMLRAIGSKAIITQQSEAESAGVVMAALSLAVSNMRRRRLRTALTLVTITSLVVALVLLTTSAAFDFKILEPSGTAAASFEGLQIYNATDRRHPLLTETVEVYEATLRDKALVIRRESVNYGYDDKSSNGALLLSCGARSVKIPYFQVMDHRDDLVDYIVANVDLGLSDAFDRMSPAARIDRVRNHEAVAGSIPLNDPARQIRFHRWRSEPGDEGVEKIQAVVTVRLSDLIEGEFLSAGDVDVCLLPDTMAEKLGVKPGDTVTVMGLPLTVKGTWVAPAKAIQTDPDGKDVEIIVPGPLDRLRDLDGRRITAMRGAKFREGEPDNPEHAPSGEVVIVPREWIRKHRILPACVYSLIVIPTGPDGALDFATITPQAEALAKEILNVDIFTHYLDRSGPLVSVGEQISMHKATHVKGSSMMLVVLGAAVLMILAIMTGTVYERMREIHIFSSVGLSPRHVAGMFLIEALVYAGIAAVLGYFLGIIALKGLMVYLRSTGQHQDFYPNYLGVFVLYSIGIAVLATVASSLYPIRLASKIVNPSEGKTWQLAEVTGEVDRWRVRLPFIATTWDEACAMMVHACDYLAIHQGERSGRFVCERPPAGAAGVKTLTLSMPVWLAPFERNLTQSVDLQAAPAEGAPWWELSLDLRRVSGPEYLWKRGATVFVNMLCKHLLRWRAATEDQQQQCLARAEATFPRKEPSH